MAIRKLKPIEERDPYAAMVLSVFDELEEADVERGPIPAQTVANKVCEHLPEGYVLNLAMENGAAWVELIDADGNCVALPDAADKSIDEQINDALCVAINDVGKD